ncbi:MAG: hypothetical protein HRT54_00410 [Colwellia sp.]|nr:hypothetical protein [Colwellia sp.]
MPVKALLAHGRAISAGTLRILGSMEETRLMQQRRVSPERVRRLTLFGCRRHPDARQVNKLQAGNNNYHLSPTPFTRRHRDKINQDTQI